MIYGSSGVKNIKTTGKERRKLVISDTEALQLARWGCAIEKHYGKPMDIEWAKDGQTQELFIVQARPETVQSQKSQDRFQSYLYQKRKSVVSWTWQSEKRLFQVKLK